MKYNGKEVTEEILNRIWEKANEGVGKFDLKYLKLFFVERVLQAAEEVFAEMHQDEFYPGQKVKDNTGREGEIILHPTSTHIWVRFGSTKVMLNKSGLTKVKEAQHGEG